eukprot:jgi/Antlo1/1682/805
MCCAIVPACMPQQLMFSVLNPAISSISTQSSSHRLLLHVSFSFFICRAITPACISQFLMISIASLVIPPSVFQSSSLWILFHDTSSSTKFSFCICCAIAPACVSQPLMISLKPCHLSHCLSCCTGFVTFRSTRLLLPLMLFFPSTPHDVLCNCSCFYATVSYLLPLMLFFPSTPHAVLCNCSCFYATVSYLLPLMLFFPSTPHAVLCNCSCFYATVSYLLPLMLFFPSTPHAVLCNCSCFYATVSYLLPLMPLIHSSVLQSPLLSGDNMSRLFFCASPRTLPRAPVFQSVSWLCCSHVRWRHASCDLLQALQLCISTKTPAVTGKCSEDRPHRDVCAEQTHTRGLCAVSAFWVVQCGLCFFAECVSKRCIACNWCLQV